MARDRLESSGVFDYGQATKTLNGVARTVQDGPRNHSDIQRRTRNVASNSLHLDAFRVQLRPKSGFLGVNFGEESQ